MKTCLLLILVLMSTAAAAFDAYLFYAPGCTNCGDVISMLTEAQDKYPNMNLQMLNIRFYDNNELYKEIQQNYGPNEYVAPVLFIGDNAYIGYTEKTQEQIQNSLNYCSKNRCVSPKEKKYVPGAFTTKASNYVWIVLGIVFVLLIVFHFTKKQIKSVDEDVKPVTKKFMD